MSRRWRSTRNNAIAFSYGLVTIAIAGPGASEGQTPIGMLAWLGCWELAEVVEEAELPEPETVSRLICVKRGDAALSLALSAIVDGEVIAERP